MIPRVKPTYGLADLAGAVRAGRDAVDRLEAELAAHLGFREAVCFPYGRSAIFTALKSLEDTAREMAREVVEPAYNCVVVAHATVKAGYTPVFVDCTDDSPNHDPEQLLSLVGPRTAAVFPTSIFGVTFDAHELVAEIRRRNEKALVLMDCCQSFDASHAGERMMAAGDAALVAFGIGKPMTTLFGGALLTSDPDLGRRVRATRDRTFRAPALGERAKVWLYFLASSLALSRPFARITDLLEFSESPLRRHLLTLRSRESVALPADNEVHMTPAEAGIGRAQLRRVDAFLARRRAIGALYDEAFRELPGLRLTDWPEGSSYAIYAARVRDEASRAAALRMLRSRGVQGDTVLAYSVPDLACYRELGHAGEKSPHARAWARTVVNFPNHPAMSGREVKRTIHAVRAAFRSGSGSARG